MNRDLEVSVTGVVGDWLCCYFNFSLLSTFWKVGGSHISERELDIQDLISAVMNLRRKISCGYWASYGDLKVELLNNHGLLFSVFPWD